MAQRNVVNDVNFKKIFYCHIYIYVVYMYNKFKKM